MWRSPRPTWAPAASSTRLIDQALHATASQLEDMVREFKSCERRARATDERHRKSRYLRHRYDADGCMIITIRLPPDEGADIKESPSDVSAETPGAIGRAYAP